VIHVGRDHAPNPQAGESAHLGVASLDEVDWREVDAWFRPEAVM